MAAQEEKENQGRRMRRVWSRRLLLERPLRGERAVLLEFEKRADPGSFYAAYRMTPNSFDELVLLLDPHLEEENTAFRDENCEDLVKFLWWRSRWWLCLRPHRQCCLFSIHRRWLRIILLHKFAHIYKYNIL